MRILALVLMIGVPLAAQSLLESATAAAGGSAAGVAGKKVSEGFGAIMGKVSNLAKDAAATADPKDKARRGPAFTPPVPLVPGAAGSAGIASVQGSASAPAPARRITPFEARMVKDPAMPIAPAYAAAMAPERAQPTVADLQSLQTGASREEVLTRMGRPAGRISIPDDGGLVEVYTFRSQSESLGKVRLVNGTITQVVTAQ